MTIITTYVSAVLGGMTTLMSNLWGFAEGNELLSVIIVLPVIGGIIARVASWSKRARG